MTPGRVTILLAMFFFYGVGLTVLVAAENWNPYLVMLVVLGMGLLLRVAYLRMKEVE